MSNTPNDEPRPLEWRVRHWIRTGERMEIEEPGHIYILNNLDGTEKTRLVFVNRNNCYEHEGTTNQEVIRALVDRVKYMEQQLPWDGNKKILFHLRMALVLHEARVLERKTEEGKIKPENIETAEDGHYLLMPNA